MIRTLHPHGQLLITRPVLRRETIRTLSDSELAAAGGGHGTNCTAETFMASGCVPTAAAVLVLPK